MKKTSQNPGASTSLAERGGSATKTKRLSAHYVANPDVGHGWQLDLNYGAPQLVIYLVWTIGTYKNGHPMFNLRAVTTDSVKAAEYSKMLRRDKEANGDKWYRIHIEPRVANHLYAECMNEFMEATDRLSNAGDEERGGGASSSAAAPKSRNG